MRPLTLADLRSIVEDTDELGKGARLFDAGGLASLARHGDRIYADAAGSGASAYKISIAFTDAAATAAHLDAGMVRARCTCMAARSRPYCKHAAALLVAWARSPEAFVEAEGPPPGSEGTRKRAVKKGKTDANALMRDGVDQVATLVRSLASSGVAALGDGRGDALRGLAEALRENKLRRLSARVLELANLLDDAASARRPLPPVEYADMLCDLLLTVRKLEKHLPPSDETDSPRPPAIEPRYIEELIGKTWRKEDRAPIADLDLVEYGFLARMTSDNFLIRESRLIDVATGTHYSEKQILPAFLVKRTPAKPSRAGSILAGASGSTFPGFAPRRLDLESPGTPRPLDEPTLARLVAHALPGVAAALAAFQEHRRDVFAPDLLPVAVRADALLADGPRLSLIDADGHALALATDAAAEEQLAGALRGAGLRAMLGDIGLDGPLPTLIPRALVVAVDGVLTLRSLRAIIEPVLTGRRRRRHRPAPGDTARPPADSLFDGAPAGAASAAAVSLADVRAELADLLALGLPSFSPRAIEAPAARLRDLGLDKPAALLDALAARPAPLERLDDAVKVYQVLGIALVRLAAAGRVERESLVPVASYPSLLVRAPDSMLGLDAVAAARAAGRINRYQAAVHLAAAVDALPVEELESRVYPLWADGSLAPFVIEALARRGPPAYAVARAVFLAPRAGRAARVTAIRIMAAIDPAAVEELLASPLPYEGHGGDEARWLRGVSQATIDAVRAATSAEAAARHGMRHASLLSYAPSAIGASDKLSRARAVGALAATHLADAAPVLRAALVGDPAAEVRETAAEALAALPDPEVVDLLLGQLARRAEDEEAARLAAIALGGLGDARGIAALIDAWATGWKPSLVADALRFAGAVALAPLLDRVEATPALLDRKVALDVLRLLPTDDVSEALEARLGRAAAGPDFATRAAPLLKAASATPTLQQRIAGVVLAMLPAAAATSAAEKALRRAASRALSAAKPDASPAG